MISFIWSWNVKKIAFGTISDRIVYASGAAFGSIVGLLISTLILK
jgi:membrane associated rhomboid family serine protease